MGLLLSLDSHGSKCVALLSSLNLGNFQGTEGLWKACPFPPFLQFTYRKKEPEGGGPRAAEDRGAGAVRDTRSLGQLGGGVVPAPWGSDPVTGQGGVWLAHSPVL